MAYINRAPNSGSRANETNRVPKTVVSRQMGMILNILAPFTEEPWLEERFGDEYREYRARVPGFLWLVKMSRAA